jgi:hypothetical protein
VDWNAIGAVADLASAFAVAVSLVYVAVQVRELKRQSNVELNMHFVENADRIRSEVWTNPEVATFLDRCFSASDPLSTVDRVRFAAYASQRLWTFVQLHRYRESHRSWSEILALLTPMMASRAGREVWTESRAQFPPEFQREIDALLATLAPAER